MQANLIELSFYRFDNARMAVPDVEYTETAKTIEITFAVSVVGEVGGERYARDRRRLQQSHAAVVLRTKRRHEGIVFVINV